MFIFSFILSLFANHLPVMYVQVPQWADDWAVCAVDIPDAKCHWYVVAPDNTFGEGFDWENAPWFDANGLNDVAPKTFKQFVSENELIKTATKDVEGVQNFLNSDKLNKKKEEYKKLLKGEGEKLRTTFEKELLPGLKNTLNQFKMK